MDGFQKGLVVSIAVLCGIGLFFLMNHVVNDFHYEPRDPIVSCPFCNGTGLSSERLSYTDTDMNIVYVPDSDGGMGFGYDFDSTTVYVCPECGGLMGVS